MKRPHQLLERDLPSILTARIICPECMYTWWVEEEDLSRELTCRRCGHRARVEKDRNKVLK
jgi:hypothetical protein